MYEFEKYEYEFSKIYKRLLRLELLIKHKIINLSVDYYKDEVMYVFSKFFNNKYINSKYCNDTRKENYFISIRDSKNIPPIIKFEKIINMLMLRHLLHFVFNEEPFRVREIQALFYEVSINKFGELRNAKEKLIALRNHIAHFNFESYNKNKIEYLQALILFEHYLGCSLGKYGEIPNNLGNKPSVMTIIQKIYELCPDLFKKNIPHSNFPYNKDRMIVDMYEDIAVLNGWEYSELKSQWDVIRMKYEFNKQKNEETCSDILETQVQISLFDNLNKEEK